MNSHALPPGFREVAFAEIDSTNAEALRGAAAGGSAGTWYRAEHQTAGRGRSGRVWQSERGNLFATLLLRPACAPGVAAQLAFVTGVAVHDTVAGVAPSARDRLALKWPNDLLIGSDKVAGILLESAAAGGEIAVAVGIGINLSSHPSGPEARATDLATFGYAVDVGEAFRHLAGEMAQWLRVWSEGEGWSEVRSAWERRSIPIGLDIHVHAGRDEIGGVYQGIGEHGELRLLDAAGKIRSVTAGDVALI